MNRTKESELEFLLNNYKWDQIDDKYPRENTTECIPFPNGWIGPHNMCYKCGMTQVEGTILMDGMTEEAYDIFQMRRCGCEICGSAGCCQYCQGSGLVIHRILWVNAKYTLITHVNNNLLLLCDYGSFFNLNLFPNLDQFSIDPTTLRITPLYDLGASSSYWDGEQAGSAIPRHPGSLRGFMYRCPVNGKDGHILPDNIVDHLIKEGVIR